jgi:hypothetical protein
MALEDFSTGSSPGDELAMRIRQRITDETRLDCKQPVAEGL